MTQAQETPGVRVRVRGLVQGVGFRPTVWRIARECGLRGDVLNDGSGVLIRAWGAQAQLERFMRRLQIEAPPLARIDHIERTVLPPGLAREFLISQSGAGDVHTAVVADAASCAACVAETFDPSSRRHLYPFTNCTHCGPRFSIVLKVPYDRANTSMAPFALCGDCRAEYEDPADRRFHAQPIACPACGPRVWLEVTTGDVKASGWAAAAKLIAEGRTVAIKGLGGFHLACDATNAAAVSALRARKRREHKAFAVMARDVEMIERFCEVDAAERMLLQSSAAPIVLLRHRGERLPDAIAPGAARLGFMLPYTPLHHLLLRDLDRPLVMTSGNVSDEPQCIADDDARVRLRDIADAYLLHDREIVSRIDDSVACVMDGAPRILRRARGYAPAPIALPRGFEAAPRVAAMGGMLKNTFCFTKDGQAMLSQHQGDLEAPAAYADYRKSLDLYRALFDHAPECIVVDAHPEYPSTRLGVEWAERDGLALQSVQHHHAHIASCLAESGMPLDSSPVLGIALDGLGMGEGGELWGGEFLFADYRGFRRVGRFKPVALIGGERAMREPWRNTYAHLVAAFGWDACRARYGELPLIRALQAKPLAMIDAMLAQNINCPLASSCGRLFDAVAGAVGICRERLSYEGQPAIELEALVDHGMLDTEFAYPFAVLDEHDGIATLDAGPMWRALLEDLSAGAEAAAISTRFHLGLARALTALTIELAHRLETHSVALTGGVFQNSTLFERVGSDLRSRGFAVLTHSKVPPGDGGLALGQAAVAAARLLY